MGFLGRAIRDGISKGVGDAIGKAVKQAVEPAATEYANKMADRMDAAAQNTVEKTSRSVSGLEGAFANLERAAQSYATEMSKNIKVCPSCGQPSGADKKFCPSCGSKLPEETVAQGAVCPNCGRQNTIGTKFCQECGTKLPFAVQEEEAEQARNDETMALWDEYLSAYPKWNCGGTEFNIEAYGGAYMFAARLPSNFAAQNAVKQYREVLQQHGFRTAGRYPDICQLYKKVGSICYHVDTEHCFDGDSDYPTIYFDIREPDGGFDYVKPEPKKPAGFRDLFNI